MYKWSDVPLLWLEKCSELYMFRQNSIQIEEAGIEHIYHMHYNMKAFDERNHEKKNINEKELHLFVNEREVWYAQL